MRIPGKRRLLLAAGSAATLGAVATLVSGVTFGLFSATQTQGPNSFTAGTVTLTQAASHTCTITDLQPGNASTGWTVPGTQDQCKLGYTYTGTSAAWLALDVTVSSTAATPQTPYTTTAASGPALTLSAVNGPANATPSAVTVAAGAGSFIAGHALSITVGSVTTSTTSAGDGSLVATAINLPSAGVYSVSVSDGTTTATSAPDFVVSAPGLYDGTANGMQLLLKDSAGPTSFITSTTFTKQDTTTAALNTSGTTYDLLVNAGTGTLSRTGFITLDYSMPNNSNSNAYQAAVTTVTMTLHAVQSDGQTLPAGGTPCVVGAQCLAQAGLAWS